jgi:predicted DNA-binding transcriptional regulator AlpA
VADCLANLPSELQQHRILVTEQAAEFCGYSVTQWRTLVREGNAPKPIQLSARKNGWKAGVLIRWLNDKDKSGGGGGVSPDAPEPGAAKVA